MKKRLPWIVVVLLSLFILYHVFFQLFYRLTLSVVHLIVGVSCLLYGGYKVIYPDKKDDNKE